MVRLIERAARIAPAGNKPKLIDEVFGRVNSGDEGISIAHMRSPAGWVEPGQRPQFDEYTYVLKGELNVEVESGEVMKVKAGQGVHVGPGEWVRYSTPDSDCEYIAICLPAFSPDNVNRDD